jgi:hypothetical protein
MHKPLFKHFFRTMTNAFKHYIILFIFDILIFGFLLGIIKCDLFLRYFVVLCVLTLLLIYNLSLFFSIAINYFVINYFIIDY